MLVGDAIDGWTCAAADTALVKGAVEPFKWHEQVNRAVYADDERAPDLTDIHFPTFKSSTLPPPPRIPDSVALHPEIHGLQMRREALVEQYREATPEKAKEVRRQLEIVDKETIKKVRSYKVDFDESDDDSSREASEPTPQTTK